jgi:hypothetical protein
LSALAFTLLTALLGTLLAQGNSEDALIGVWEGTKLDGQHHKWNLFGPFRIEKGSDGVAVTYLGSRVGERDHEMYEPTFEDGTLRMQWGSWGGWVFEATLVDDSLRGHLHHHNMSEEFTLTRLVERSDREIIAQFNSATPHKVPPSQSQFISILLNKGPDEAMKIYAAVKEQDPDHKLYGPGSINRLGYRLLQQRKTEDAIEVFKFNVLAYPEDPNSYDSLGEGYVRNGDRDLAIEALKKSLSMNPPPHVRANSIKLLKELGVDYEGL